MKYYYKIVNGKIGKLLNESQLAEKGLTEADMLAEGRMIADTDDAMFKVFEDCGQADKAAIYGVCPSEADTPEVSEFKTMLSDYIAEMNAKYATLGLLITDSVIDAAQKIEATDMTKTEAMYLDMLRRNLKDAQNNHQYYQAR